VEGRVKLIQLIKALYSLLRSMQVYMERNYI